MLLIICKFDVYKYLVKESIIRLIECLHCIFKSSSLNLNCFPFFFSVRVIQYKISNVSDCPPGYTQFGMKCYRTLFTTLTNTPSNTQHCGRNTRWKTTPTLAVIGDVESNYFLHTLSALVSHG